MGGLLGGKGLRVAVVPSATATSVGIGLGTSVGTIPSVGTSLGLGTSVGTSLGTAATGKPKPSCGADNYDFDLCGWG